MKKTEQATVPLNMTLSQAERIETEFVRIGPIALECRKVINEARTKDAHAKEKAPDEALIPVTVRLTLEGAKTILKRYGGLVRESPTDRAIYILVKNAIEKE
ncbi:MAG TPA: hypothetical protein VI488_02615 [Candidatus Angelobacter sp.]